MDTLQKIWHRIQSREKIDIFENIPYSVGRFFRSLIFAKIYEPNAENSIRAEYSVYTEISSKTSSLPKNPKTQVWKQVLILNLKAHFHNYVCYLQILLKISAQNFRCRQNFLLKYISRNFHQWPANDFKKLMYCALNTQRQKTFTIQAKMSSTSASLPLYTPPLNRILKNFRGGYRDISRNLCVYFLESTMRKCYIFG